MGQSDPALTATQRAALWWRTTPADDAATFPDGPGDYHADRLLSLEVTQLREERDFLFKSIRNYLAWRHADALREAQDKLIAVTAALQAKRRQKENY